MSNIFIKIQFYYLVQTQQLFFKPTTGTTYRCALICTNKDVVTSTHLCIVPVLIIMKKTTAAVLKIKI